MSRQTPRSASSATSLAVGETVILLNPLLPLVGVSIVTVRGCQRNDSLADGYTSPSSRAASTPCAMRFACERQMRHPGLKLNIPPWLYCMSWCPDFEFRGT